MNPDGADFSSWRTTLANRGVDGLLDEYETSTDLDRIARLEKFFRLCTPTSSHDSPEDRVVKVASDADLLLSGRVTVLKPGAAKAFELLGEIVPEPEIQLIDLHDATILPDQTVFAQGLYLTDQVRHMSGNWLASGEGYQLDDLYDLDCATRLARLRLPKARVTLPTSSVYFLFHAVIGSLSFGHFILDMMIQLIVYDHLRREHGDRLVPIIVNDLHKPFKWPGMYWLFEGLIGSPTDILHVRSGAYIDVGRAFTSNRLAHLGAGGVSTRAFNYLRTILFARFGASAGSSAKKLVYISRKDAGYREAENIGEVENLLAKYGFHTVVIQELTPQEAFDGLHEAEVIVGMHGSGLMYNLYTEKPATLIELSHPGFEWQIILACATACGHRPIRIGYKGNEVDLDALQLVLYNLLTTRASETLV